MKKNDLFPSKYIKAEDLAEEVTVIIAGLEMEDMQNMNDPSKKEKKGVLYFKGIDKGLVLNKTNWDRIEAQHGEESDDWVGKKIVLFAEAEARSESGWSARVKPARPMPKGGGLKPLAPNPNLPLKTCRKRSRKMKRADLFPAKVRLGRIDRNALFTPEQAQANQELMGQAIMEAGLDRAATVFFYDFYVGHTRRNWLLPESGETWRDLTPVQTDYVLKHLDWFLATIKRLKESKKLVEDDLVFKSAPEDDLERFGGEI